MAGGGKLEGWMRGLAAIQYEPEMDADTGKGIKVNCISGNTPSLIL